MFPYQTWSSEGLVLFRYDIHIYCNIYVYTEATRGGGEEKNLPPHEDMIRIVDIMQKAAKGSNFTESLISCYRFQFHRSVEIMLKGPI